MYHNKINQSPIRTAGLEQEIENLKKKLAECTRDNTNLQEELSEAYRIKVISVTFNYETCLTPPTPCLLLVCFAFPRANLQSCTA
jgi:hypothetical protein